jgi:S1-C subfamily serine protease
MKTRSTILLAVLCVGLTHPLVAQEPTGLTAAIALEQAMIDTIAKCEKSVVAVSRVRKGFGPKLLDPEFVPNEYATGIVVDRAGLILTVYHALGDPERNDYAVWIAGKGYIATIKAADPTFDLAVLQIEADSLTPMPLGEAGELKKGQIVIALGNPQAIARDGEPSATWGIVANLHRKMAAERDPASETEIKDTLHHYGTLIQTDARLERGTSGGALINLKGEMVGLTSAAAALAGSEEPAGFAIPVNDAFRHVLQQLKLGRKVAYGFLGVAPEERFDDEAGGVPLVNVVHGTPASGKLSPGDVVTHIGGSRLTSPGDLILKVAEYPAGDTVQVRFLRGGRAMTQSIELSKKYIRTARPSIATVEQPNWRGVTVDFSTAHPRFVELSPDADEDGCVVVVDVDPHSPGWKAGLRSGVFISHVGQKRVSSPEGFYGAVSEAEGTVRLQPASQFNRAEAIVVKP